MFFFGVSSTAFCYPFSPQHTQRERLFMVMISFLGGLRASVFLHCHRGKESKDWNFERILFQ